jgi:hypothetical protein
VNDRLAAYHLTLMKSARFPVVHCFPCAVSKCALFLLSCHDLISAVNRGHGYFRFKPRESCFDSRVAVCDPPIHHMPCRCKKPKPPNTHHCRICGKCVVDMDHHCPFLNNCVGRGNLRHFLLFLLWVTIAMIYSLTMLMISILEHRSEIVEVRRSLWQPCLFLECRCPCVDETVAFV